MLRDVIMCASIIQLDIDLDDGTFKTILKSYRIVEKDTLHAVHIRTQDILFDAQSRFLSATNDIKQTNKQTHTTNQLTPQKKQQ